MKYQTYHGYYGYADRPVFGNTRTWKNPPTRFERFLYSKRVFKHCEEHQNVFRTNNCRYSNAPALGTVLSP